VCPRLIWHHARSRRAGPLHRWPVDGSTAGAVPMRTSARTKLGAGWAPAVLMLRRPYDLGLPPMRHCGVRTADWPAVPGSARRGRSAVTQVLSESSRRTRSIAAMTAGSSGLSPSLCRALRSSSSTPVLDVRPVVTVPRWCMAALVPEVLTALPSVWSSDPHNDAITVFSPSRG
jgi:hypothetical protein